MGYEESGMACHGDGEGRKAEPRFRVREELIKLTETSTNGKS